MPTDYRFTDQKLHESLGIYHMGARWYDSALSRWLSADTIVPDLSDPQSLNRYAWVLGNPVRYVDPSGHTVDSPIIESTQRSGNVDDLRVDNSPYIWFPPSYYPTPEERHETLAFMAVSTGVIVSGGFLIADLGPWVSEALAWATTQAARVSAQDVWKLSPLERGRAIYRMLGENLASNFPTIDRFYKGVATSIKSIDLGAKTYQKHLEGEYWQLDWIRQFNRPPGPGEVTISAP